MAQIKKNPKAFYSFAKRKRKVQSTVGPLISSNGELTDEPMKKAELLQDQYVKVFSDPEMVNAEVALKDIEDREAELTHIELSPADIKAALKELNPHSAAPNGDIPSVILHEH